MIQVGRNLGTGQLNISGGGQVYGNGPNGLVAVQIGRGGNGTVTIDGAGSSLALSGVGGLNTQGFDNIGGLLQIGRDTNGVGSVSVTNGGSILVSDGGQSATAGGMAIVLGRDATSTGSLTVSGGTSSIRIEQTGAGSTSGAGMNIGSSGTGTVLVNGGADIVIHADGQAAAGGSTGMTLGLNAGGSGTLTVSGAGSTLTIEQGGAATIGAGITVGRSGGGQIFVDNGGSILIRADGAATAGVTIARDANSTGSVSVSGAGSSLTIEQGGASGLTPSLVVGRQGAGSLAVSNGATVAVNGPSQRNFNVGNAAGGNGTLTVSSGAAVSSSYFTVGNNGGTGVATINNAFVNLDGQSCQPDNSHGRRFPRRPRHGQCRDPEPRQRRAGHDQHRSHDAGNLLGGPGTALGGNGTINMSGGSSVAFTGTGATPKVVIGHSGTGLWTMSGASTLSVPADGTIKLGARSTGTGTMTVGASTIMTGNLIVGDAGIGDFNQSSGTTSVTNLIAGNQATGNGTINISGGALNVAADARIGKDGTGTFTQSLGTTTVTGGLLLGASTTPGGTGTGTVNLSGGTLTTGSASVGDSGVGTFNQTGGTHATGSLGLGNCGGCGGVNSSGTYNLSGTGVLTASSVTVGAFGQGNFNQSGTTTATIAGDLTVGSGPRQPDVPGNNPFRLGIVAVSDGSLAIGGNVIIGAGNTFFAGEPGGKGSVTQTGGSVTIAGNLIIGEGSAALAGPPVTVPPEPAQTAGGKGMYVMSGGSLTVTGQTIVGGEGPDAAHGGIGTLLVNNGATMNAGTFLGIGHNGTLSNGAIGTVILDGGAQITATTIKIGSGGCLAGNGTLHGDVIMEGDTSIGSCDTSFDPSGFNLTPNASGRGVGIQGFLKPGRSPGTLVIDGSFQFISGTIVLEVQSDGLGGFLTDQLIFTDGTIPDLTQAKIEIRSSATRIRMRLRMPR